MIPIQERRWHLSSAIIACETSINNDFSIFKMDDSVCLCCPVGLFWELDKTEGIEFFENSMM